MKFTIQMFGFSTNVFIKSNEEKSSYVPIYGSSLFMSNPKILFFFFMSM